MKNTIKLFALFVLLSGCEKEIDIVLPEAERRMVVEGHVELGSFPYVILTKSSPYFAPVDSAAIANTVIYGATVIVSDGNTTDTLKQTFDLNYFPPVLYKAQNMVGTIGRTYNLTVIAEGKTLTATTYMPDTVPLDSVWFKVDPPKDSLGFVYAHLSDPAGPGHSYRWFAKRTGKDTRFLAPIGSAFDDKFFDGKSFDFFYTRGIEYNSSKEDDNNEERGYFKKGDQITVKFCTIDQESFKFYRTFEVEAASNGNPFAAPTTIQTNIKGGGLGVWGAYSITYKTLIAQ